MKFTNWIRLGIIMIIVVYGGAWFHEKAHQMVYEDYGIKSEIKPFIGGLMTVPEPYKADKETQYKIITVQENIEAIKYNYASIELALIFIMSIMAVNYLEKKEKEETT